MDGRPDAGRSLRTMLVIVNKQISKVKMKFMDQVLSPIVKDLPSFVQETPHLLRIIKDFRFPDSSNHNPLLFTMDVTSLYTSIPHDGALQALKHFLDRRKDCTISNATLLRLAELVLSMNTFQFNW